MDDIVDIALRFMTTPTDTTGTGGEITVTPYGGGNINDTYVVEPAGGPRFILQRINQHVFPKPQLIMINLRTVMEHIARQPDHTQEERRWELPDLVPARDGQDFIFEPTKTSGAPSTSSRAQEPGPRSRTPNTLAKPAML